MVQITRDPDSWHLAGGGGASLLPLQVTTMAVPLAESRPLEHLYSPPLPLTPPHIGSWMDHTSLSQNTWLSPCHLGICCGWIYYMPTSHPIVFWERGLPQMHPTLGFKGLGRGRRGVGSCSGRNFYVLQQRYVPSWKRPGCFLSKRKSSEPQRRQV